MKELLESLKEVWQLQTKLMDVYISLDRLGSYPEDINSREGQANIRMDMHFFVEELAEMAEVIGTPEFNEEAADCTHFLMELTILSFNSVDEFLKFVEESKGLDPAFLTDSHSPAEWLWSVVFSIHYASNKMKNKPWKVTLKDTDERPYKLALASAWLVFLGFLDSVGVDLEVLVNEYKKKNLINYQRVEGDY